MAVKVSLVPRFSSFIRFHFEWLPNEAGKPGNKALAK